MKKSLFVHRLVGSAIVVGLCCPVASAVAVEHRMLTFSIVDGVVAGTPDTVKVNQGDDLEIKWSSDKPMALHLHGYDIEVNVSPQAPAVMSFKANIPGRFPIEAHGQGRGSHPAILYLEVHP